jgi:hypothetical protein
MLDADITKRRHLRHRDGRIRAFSGGLVEDGWSVVVPVTMKDSSVGNQSGAEAERDFAREKMISDLANAWKGQQAEAEAAQNGFETAAEAHAKMVDDLANGWKGSAR